MFSLKLFLLVGSLFSRACLARIRQTCRQLKNAGKIHSAWFWNNSFSVKLNERSQSTKIHHVIDIEKLLGVVNLDKFINNTSF